uniref:Uncharacterized protein n=1 Tax=viral metagenome TaxID=1070528 RepID=A0A6H2A0G4_9ZZZZ
MEKVTNKTIKKVFKGKSGEGKYGPWQAYDVYFEGSENKYTYFGGENKPEPVVGQKISYLEFDTKQDGKYTNRTIRKLVLDETASQPSKDAPQSAKEGQAYINHGECVIKLMEMAGGKECSRSTMLALVELFLEGIDAMIKPPDYPKEEDFEPPGDVPEDMDPIPF